MNILRALSFISKLYKITKCNENKCFLMGILLKILIVYLIDKHSTYFMHITEFNFQNNFRPFFDDYNFSVSCVF